MNSRPTPYQGNTLIDKQHDADYLYKMHGFCTARGLMCSDCTELERPSDFDALDGSSPTRQPFRVGKMEDSHEARSNNRSRHWEVCISDTWGLCRRASRDPMRLTCSRLLPFSQSCRLILRRWRWARRITRKENLASWYVATLMMEIPGAFPVTRKCDRRNDTNSTTFK